jgi:hypothetical protein
VVEILSWGQFQATKDLTTSLLDSWAIVLTVQNQPQKKIDPLSPDILMLPNRHFIYWYTKDSSLFLRYNLCCPTSGLLLIMVHLLEHSCSHLFKVSQLLPVSWILIAIDLGLLTAFMTFDLVLELFLCWINAMSLLYVCVSKHWNQCLEQSRI